MLIMFFRNNTRLLYANIFIKMDIEKDCIFNKRGKEVSIVIGIDIILTAVFNVNNGERVSLVSVLSLANCTVKNREDILLVYLKSLVQIQIWGKKIIIRETLLTIGFIFRKKPKLNISIKLSGVLFCF